MTGDVTGTVFVVDDDSEVRQALTLLFKSVGRTVQTFATAEDFLERTERPRPACIVTDVRMPGMSGLELQVTLAHWPNPPPVILVTAYGEVDMAVAAMKAGAFDFLTKPYRPDHMLDRVSAALAEDMRQLAEIQARADFDRRLQTLTAREREVLDLLVRGKTTKQIAQSLGIVLTTVDFHRTNILAKMDATNVVVLAHRAAQYQ